MTKKSKKNKIKTMDNNELLTELINKQIKNIKPEIKLQYTDLRRICKYIKSSIFDENQCCIWDGYVTNQNNSHKGKYINFYFRKKKVALHRLLYSNFVGELGSDEYLKFNCENKGTCCNIKHLKKFKFNKKEKIKSEYAEGKKDKRSSKNMKTISILTGKNNKRLEVCFD